MARNIATDERGSIALLDPQMQNIYSYTRNNPVNYYDPSGEYGFLAQLGQVLVNAIARLGTAQTLYEVGDTLLDSNSSESDLNEAQMDTNMLISEELIRSLNPGKKVENVLDTVGAIDTVVDNVFELSEIENTTRPYVDTSSIKTDLDTPTRNHDSGYETLTITQEKHDTITND